MLCFDPHRAIYRRNKDGTCSASINSGVSWFPLTEAERQYLVKLMEQINK